MTELINRSAFTSLTAFLTPPQSSLPLQQKTKTMSLLREHIKRCHNVSIDQNSITFFLCFLAELNFNNLSTANEVAARCTV